MAAYTVLANRYRPRSFDDVVGQADVARVLRAAFVGGRVGHAFLLSGPRGVGKTSMARILAKAFNCLENEQGEPCGVCRVCKSIDGQGEALDVVEIDGASHNKVENVRDLIENLRFRPVEARHRISIIDEVHMLSTAAFNALLKTLEEPPEHAKFILATTEPLKVPETIRSRCQMLDFQRLPAAVIAERLTVICKAEGVEVPEDVLRAVARHAQGGLRDALSLLDQLITFADGAPTLADVQRLTGRLSAAVVHDLVDAILRADVPDVQARLEALLAAGSRPPDVVAQLTEFCEGLLVAAAGGEVADRTSEEAAALGALAARTQVDHVLAMLDVLVEAGHRLRLRHDGRLVVEMAVLTLARLPHLVALGDWLASGGSPAGSVGGSAPPRLAEPARTSSSAEPAARDAWSTQGAPPRAAARPARDEPRDARSAETRRPPAAPPASSAQRPAAATGAAPELELEPAPASAAPDDFRTRLLETLPSRALRLELSRYRSVEIQGDKLVLVPPAEGLASILDPSRPPQREQLLQAASALHGAPVELEVRGDAAPARPAPSTGAGEGGTDAEVRRLWPDAERVDF